MGKFEHSKPPRLFYVFVSLVRVFSNPTTHGSTDPHLHHWLAKFHGLRSCAHPPPNPRRGRIDWNLLNWNCSKSWYLGRRPVEIFVEAVARVLFFPRKKNLQPRKNWEARISLSFWGVRLVSSSLGEEEFNFKYGAIFWVSSPFFHNCMWNSMGNLPIFSNINMKCGNLQWSDPCQTPKFWGQEVGKTSALSWSVEAWLEIFAGPNDQPVF